ncbi:zinc finger CHY domain-containing protein [Apiospora saccharicola]|uniref:Zinc finger CHY domain-containing protein n=1 Tax=Apiospora saccharicola TaxID=335842 RepID=A0ABR1VKV2_9PEZI
MAQSGVTPSNTAGPTVLGVSVSPLTQCSHWHSERDIIAIRHKCCGDYYACISCHEALARHPPQVWPKAEQASTRAVLCGECRHELTIDEYLSCGSSCPQCRALFNPGCANHYSLYFET